MQRPYATTVANVYRDIGTGIGTDLRTPPRPLIVPHWLTPVLALHKLDVTVLKNPDLLKKHVSRDMLLDLVAVNRYIFRDEIRLHTYMTSCHAAYDIPDMDHLIHSEVQARETVALATLGLPGDAVVPDQLYRIQDLDTDVFLIFVEPGFTTHLLRFRDRALAFVSECLRTQYRFASISTVARTELFRIYLDLLADQPIVQ